MKALTFLSMLAMVGAALTFLPTASATEVCFPDTPVQECVIFGGDFQGEGACNGSAGVSSAQIDVCIERYCTAPVLYVNGQDYCFLTVS